MLSFGRRCSRLRMRSSSLSQVTAVHPKPLPMVSVPCRAGRNFDFDPASTALLVIDMQRDFLEREGDEDGDGAAPLRAIAPRVRDLLARARAAGLACVHTREG